MRNCWRHCRRDPLHHIAMRIDEGKPSASFQILTSEIFQERRFSDAGLAENVDMREAVRLFYAEAAEPAAERGLADV